MKASASTMSNKKTSPPQYTSPIPTTRYTPGTPPIWSLRQPRAEPYAITTPALKLFSTDLVDLSKSLQELVFEHTPPQVPTNLRKTHLNPEYHYLGERRACLSKYIKNFVPTPGDQRMASEIGELENYMTATVMFSLQKLFGCMVEGAKDIMLVILKSDVENLTTALGVLKADYAAAHNAGTDSYWKMVKDYQYLRERVINIDNALAEATRAAKKSGSQTAINECEKIKEMVKGMKLFKSSIDRVASKALFKGMFTGNKPAAASAGGSNDPPPYASLTFEDAAMAESLNENKS